MAGSSLRLKCNGKLASARSGIKPSPAMGLLLTKPAEVMLFFTGADNNHRLLFTAQEGA